MNNKNDRVTIYDIAEALNVSPSTVTRSLNNNTCISEETRTLVHEMANKLGYRKNMLAHGLKSKPVKIGLILRNKFPEFQNLLVLGARKAADELSDFNVSLEYEVLGIPDYDKKLVVKFNEYVQNGLDGIIYFPLGVNPSISSIVKEKNIRAASLFYDAGESGELDFYATVDFAYSGRIAANLFAMAGLKEGDQIAYFTGQRDMVHHKLSIDSFLEMNERYHFNVSVIDHQDNEKIAYYATEQLLNENPGIKGIFCSTAVTIPVCDRVVEANMADKIVIIGTDLFVNTVPYIEKNILNAVIFQNPFKLGYLAVQTMYKCILGNEEVSKAILINPQIVIQGNVSYYEKRITNVVSDF